MRVIRILIYVKNCLSFRNIVSSFKIFLYNLLKQNTRYPNYLLNFEKEISKYFGSKYALSFSNGTTACTALLYSLGVKKNSKIILSKLTFPSVVSSILRVGAITEIELKENDPKKAKSIVEDMCKKLLANLVIENYKIIETQ